MLEKEEDAAIKSHAWKKRISRTGHRGIVRPLKLVQPVPNGEVEEGNITRSSKQVLQARNLLK
jgi:hypothetical protein